MKKMKGFTLLELLVTLAIFSLLLGIVYINYGGIQSFAHEQNLKTQSREVLHALQVNKNNGVMDGCTRKILIFKDKLYIQTIKDIVETEKIEFRDSIRITSNTYDGKRLVFKPVGTVNLGGHFTLESVEGHKMTIVVQVGSGRIYLKDGGL